MTKKDIETFLIEKPGYLKKAPIETAKSIWKKSSKYSLPKNSIDLEKDLNLIKTVQQNFRKAQTLQKERENSELVDLYNQILDRKNAPKKRLFFDIETTPNIVFSWRIGNKININHDNIIHERAIICICYKWEGEDKVYSLSWDEGNDKPMLEKFAKIIDSADEICTQNGDKFDVKWVRARCIFHGIPVGVKFNSIDTLKLAKAGFYFNSYKLDYMGEYLGVGNKIKTEFDLWKDIILGNDKVAMTKMIDYCKEDVRLLERVYNKLRDYCPEKKFKYKIK